MTTFNAWSLAKAWNSVALAQSNDKGRPALFRTTLIEQFPEGVRLVATDAYILLKAWVPGADYDDAVEPGQHEVPEEATVCMDRDKRVQALMTYAMDQTKKDGADTLLTMTMMLGTMKPGTQGSLEGMSQSTVTFQFDHEYDERIETPIFDGMFPEWKNLWWSHVTYPTTRVSFGADGFLRIGKLSALWDKASIRFDMGGALGVAKFYVTAPDVNVEGLAMPITDRDAPEANDPLPPSEEGIHAEYGDALDEFLADVLKTEVHDDDDEVIDAAKHAQFVRAAKLVQHVGYGDWKLIFEGMEVSPERAEELLDDLVDAEVLVKISTNDDETKYVMGDKADEIIEQLGAGGEPEPPESGEAEPV